jgi:hypothetical protein
MTDPDGDRCGVGYLSSKGTYERFTGNQSPPSHGLYFPGAEADGSPFEEWRHVRHHRHLDLGRKIAKSYGLRTNRS